MHTTSPSLLMRLREPDQTEAWERFVRLYSPILYSWACRLGLQNADALDLVQDVFATLVQKLPEFTYDNHRGFRNWLWTVTRNKLREKHRRRTLPTDGNQKLDELSGREDNPLEEIEFRRYLLAELMPTFRDRFEPLTWRAFWAQVADGKSAPAVAAELGLSVAAVYKAKVRVLSRLHKELADLL